MGAERYTIVYAAFLVLFGRLAERYRRERAFLLGVAVFVAASAAWAREQPSDAGGIPRAAGRGRALLTPTSLGLILATFPPERRYGAVRTWTAVGGIAAAIGPVVGGLLVAASWRWVFYVNVPVGVLALIVGWRRLPRVPGQPVPFPDLLGALLITGGVAALVLGLVNGGSWGWGDARTLTALGAGVVALALFAVHTATNRNPLIDRALFRLRSFTGASAVALLFSAAFGGMLLSRVLWAQDVWHWSALADRPGDRTGAADGAAVLVPRRRAVDQRFGAGAGDRRRLGDLRRGRGLVGARDGSQPDYAGEMLGGMLLTGIGVGLTLPTFMATGTAALPPHSFATGSAVINMLRQIGLAIGVAVLIALLGRPTLQSRPCTHTGTRRG